MILLPHSARMKKVIKLVKSKEKASHIWNLSKQTTYFLYIIIHFLCSSSNHPIMINASSFIVNFFHMTRPFLLFFIKQHLQNSKQIPEFPFLTLLSWQFGETTNSHDVITNYHNQPNSFVSSTSHIWTSAYLMRIGVFWCCDHNVDW